MKSSTETKVTGEIIGHQETASALIHDQALCSLIVNNSNDIIWMWGFGDHRSYISPSIYPFTGYTPEEFLKLPLEKQVRGSSLPLMLNLLGYFQRAAEYGQEILQPEEYWQRIEVELNCKDGSGKWAEINAGYLLNENRQIIGVQGITRDIHERKGQEIDTSKMLNEEKKINEMKSQIISTISHEFRTPISIINSNLQLLNNYNYQLKDEIQKDAFELSFLAISSLTNILDDITVLHKSNKGILNYKPALLDVTGFVKGIVNELHSIPENKGRIELQLETSRSLYKMDKSLLEHILTNLLTNALKFSPNNKKVVLHVKETANSEMEIVFKDQGIGIPDEDLGNIWDSFFRGSNIKGTKGTGLGMAIVKRSVEKHKGEIYINSIVNQGTEVKVMLPYE